VKGDVGSNEALECVPRRRTQRDGASKARQQESCLHSTGSIDAHPPHVQALVPPADDIHAVTAAGDGLAISPHIYGADIERLGSSIHRRFDDLRVLAANCPRPLTASVRAR
jgi:hypothetical protein